MKEFNIVNLTPHDVIVILENGIRKVYKSQGIARAKQTDSLLGKINGVPVVVSEFGEPEGLPDPVNGTMYIVSLATANAAKACGRATYDLLLTSGPVRDENGVIVGCRQFAKLERTW